MHEFSEKLKKPAFYLPSSLLAVLFLLIVIFSWKPSVEPDIFIFSYYRLFLLIVSATLCTYFVVSLFKRRLSAANNFMTYVVVTVAIFHEAILRLAPCQISDQIFFLLPDAARQNLNCENKHPLHQNMQGEGLLYSLQTPLKSKNYPWLVVGKYGYRNKAPLGKNVDVVLLGGSMVLAAKVKRDVVSMFQDSGVNAYSLAMRQYSPFQHRDAYKKYIVDKGVKNKNIFVQLSTPVDLDKAFLYKHLEKNGGTWLNYIGAQPSMIPLSISDDKFPWTLVILNKIPYLITKKFKGRSAITPERNISISLEYDTVQVGANFFKIDKNELAMLFLEEASADIIELGKTSGARVNFLYTPSPAIRHLVNIKGWETEKKRLEEHYRHETAWLKKFIEERGGYFFDLTGPLRAAEKKEPIFLELTDTHFNQRGVEVMFDIIKELMPAQ